MLCPNALFGAFADRVKESESVVDGIRAFYDAFNSGSAEKFASVIAESEGTSIIGSAAGEGHADRASWLKTYADLIEPAGLRLRGGPDPRGYAHGDSGFVVDEPAFVLPDGSRLPTRLTGVLMQDDGAWKVVHLHFSVGVPDADALQPPAR